MSESLNRRGFGKQLLAGATVPVTISLGVEAAEPTKSAASTAEGDASNPTKSPSRADLIVDCLKRQYPDSHLDEAALDEIRGAVERNLSTSELLSRFPLTNADQPATIFRPFRSELPRQQDS